MGVDHLAIPADCVLKTEGKPDAFDIVTRARCGCAPWFRLFSPECSRFRRLPSKQKVRRNSGPGREVLA